MPQIYDAALLRRELHEMPELAMQEVKTSAYVLEKLQALGIEAHRIGDTTGVLGIIRGTEPGPVMMLRADMDATARTARFMPAATTATRRCCSRQRAAWSVVSSAARSSFFSSLPRKRSSVRPP